MSTHKAVAAVSKGHFDEIQVSTDVPGQNQVLIKVAYATLTAFDNYLTDLGYFVSSYPAGLGFSCSGIVEKVGPGITDLQIGDRVSGPSPLMSRPSF